MSSWRQASTSRLNDNESITEISKVRLENTRLKIELETLRKESEPVKQQLGRLTRELTEFRQKEAKAKKQLITISVIANCSDIYKINDICQFLEIIEQKMLENKERYLTMERDLNKMQRSANQSGQNIHDKLQAKQRELETSIRTCQLRENQIRQLRQKGNEALESFQRLQSQMVRKDSILAEQSHRITQMQIERKELEADAKNYRGANKCDSIKKQCEEILAQIQIKDDDYLKSYLLKNQRFHQNTNSISRKNKHDFIFQ